MKKLTFTTADAKIFQSIFEAFHLAARPATPAEHQSTATLLDALESISIELHQVVPGFDRNDTAAPYNRMLKLDGGTVCFKDSDFQFLTQALSGISTLPVRSREIAAMWTFLNGAHDVQN